MPSVSRKQQRFFGIVRAAQKGTLESETTPEVQRAAASMKKSDVKKFASTKHKRLPEKKVTKESFNEDYVKELEDGLVKMDYPTYDEVDKLMCKIAKENDIDTTTLHMAFKTKHLMVPDDWAKKKMMEPVMIPKTPQITGDVKEGVTAQERFKRDAGKIAKNKLRQKEHEKYVNFLDVDEAVNSKQQAAIAISKKQRLMDLMVAKKKKRTNESVETINELSQDTMASAAKKAMQKRDAARGTPEYGRRQKQVLKFVSGAVKKRQQRDRAENSFKKPDADRPPTLPESSFNINPEEHNKAKRQAKIRNMTKSSNPNEKKVAERKVTDKTQLPKLNTEENINEISADLAGKAARAASKKYQYADSNETKNKAYKQTKKFATYADKKYRKLNSNRASLNKTFNKPSAVKEGGWDDIESIVFKNRANKGENTNPDFKQTVKNSKKNPLKDLKNKLSAKKETNEEATSPFTTPALQRKKKIEDYKKNADRVLRPKNNKPDAVKEGILPDIILQKKIPLGDKDNLILSAKEKKKKETQTEGSLHKWFKGSKSKDGKGGWVNVVTGGTCASDEPGEGTPKCVSSSKRASMTKAERLSASRRKKKADPNQQSKSGAAKPTYVSTDKKKVKKESYIPEEGYDHIKDRIAMSGGDPSSPKKKDATTLPVSKEIKNQKGKTVYQKQAEKEHGKGVTALDIVKKNIKKKHGKGAIMGEGKDLSGKHEKGDKPIKVNLKDLVNKAKNNPKNKNLGVKPPTDITEKKVRRDEYGDIVGGPPISKKQLKKNLASNEKDEKITHSNSYQPDMSMVEDMSGMSQKSGDKRSTESGAGMTAAGVAKYNRRTGGNLKTAVTGKVKRGSKAAKRRKSFCARSKGWTGERGKAARRRWKCNNSTDYMFELEHGEVLNERGPSPLGFGTRKSSIHTKKGRKSTKKVSGMIKSLKRKGSVLKQSMGPLDASRKASRLKNLKDDVDLKRFSIFINEGHMNKTCGEGEYYCYQSKKCKKIPKGMKIGYGGMLKPDKDDSEETKGKNGNGNGNGNGHGGNGNGNGNGGGDGGGE